MSPFAGLPPRRRELAARSQIRDGHLIHGARVAVFDDDPTGSQCVSGCSVVTDAQDVAEIERGLARVGSTCFVWTNTRSLPPLAASEVNATVARGIWDFSLRTAAPVEIVSRSDSTLRGHVVEEIATLNSVRRQVSGKGYDGVLFVPSYFEAGRCTVGDIHLAQVRKAWTPVAETEFARDATFGYGSSNLRNFLSEKSAGAIDASQVKSVSIEDIRVGGRARVGEILCTAPSGSWFVINATCYEDLDIVALAAMDTIRTGRSLVYRTGPSFVQVIAGLPAEPPLNHRQLWPDGRVGGNGLVVVGSHVGLTTRQIAVAREAGGLDCVELDVDAILGQRRRSNVEHVVRQVAERLRRSDVMLMTSRAPRRDPDPEKSLKIARAVSQGIVDVVRGVRSRSEPGWVVAKGGITSHDVAVGGLGIRRAVVAGQLLPGYVSVLRSADGAGGFLGPYVVFAGNVGDESTLAYVVAMLRGRAHA
ncbi:MAG TPA: four-carbon acid sugar kinase family protein [Candidatus Saccharimonadales bacterium]|nr:four-carbon acid sugar kinase family protein [Candidatus Saccharimonadales bacterium]